jgi:hypothetical protein
MHPTKDRDKWKNFVNTVRNFSVRQNAEIFWRSERMWNWEIWIFYSVGAEDSSILKYNAVLSGE